MLTVGELTRRLKGAVEPAFPDVWVSGEVGNLRRQPSGHVYFGLKDADASIDAVLWASTARKVRFDLRDGTEVVARGRVEIYAPRGRYQLVVQEVEPRGAGARALALQQLKERLAAEGLLDEGRKRPLPFLPAASASPPAPPARRCRTSSAWSTGASRARGCSSPAPGPGRRGRGHGDLGPRASRRLRGGRGRGHPGRGLHRRPVGLQRGAAGPVHLRLPGAGGQRGRPRDRHHRGRLRRRLPRPDPHAAAEVVVPVRDDLVTALSALRGRLVRAEGNALGEGGECSGRCGQALGPPPRPLRPASPARRRGHREEAAVAARLRAERARVGSSSDSLRRREPRALLRELRRRRDPARERLLAWSASTFRRESTRLAGLAARLEPANVAKLLRRGFALALQDGRPLRRSAEVIPGATVRVVLGEGWLDTRVESRDLPPDPIPGLPAGPRRHRVWP